MKGLTALKQYGAIINNDQVHFTYNNKAFLSFGPLEFNVTEKRNEEFVYIPDRIEDSGSEITIYFKGKSYSGIHFLKVIIKEMNGTLAFSIDAKTICDKYVLVHLFKNEDAIKIKYNLPFEPERFIQFSNSNHMFFLDLDFEKSPDSIHDRCECMLMKHGDVNYAYMTVFKNKISCHIDKNIININAGISTAHICGEFLIVSAHSDPYKAVHGIFTDGKQMGVIDVALKKDRAYPRVFDGIGWCTWNAFYTDVTSEKIYSKLDELKEKGVKLKWILIDDGWFCYKDRKLFSFEEDRKKFPEGLKNCIKKIKEEYGVPYVGVWQAFTGYWDGIHEDSNIIDRCEKFLFKTKYGNYFPGETAEKSYGFWNEWHSYLKKQDVDFVKVDHQSAYSYKLIDAVPLSRGVRGCHEGLEMSVNKHFSGAIINCMGGDMMSVLNRQSTCISRISDDYFPDRDGSFVHHLVQNVYNSVFNDEINNCDFDMWWTKHPSAKQSAVLRAISGGPVYVSDEVGNTDSEYILPLIDDMGNILRMEDAAKPTYDCLFTDCPSEGYPLKIYNRFGKNFSVAAFGLTKDKKVSAKLKLADIPCVSNDCDDYLVHDFFSDKYFVMNKSINIDIELNYNEVVLYSFYPIKDGKAYVGNKSKYAQIASETYDEVLC